MDGALRGRTKGPNPWQRTAKANNMKLKRWKTETAIPAMRKSCGSSNNREIIKSLILCNIGKCTIQFGNFLSEDFKCTKFWGSNLWEATKNFVALSSQKEE